MHLQVSKDARIHQTGLHKKWVFRILRIPNLLLHRGSNVYNVECFLVSGIFHGHFAQRLAVNKPCLQIVRRLLWKQTTTHSIRNNNPIFDREEPLVKQIRPTVYFALHLII